MRPFTSASLFLLSLVLSQTSSIRVTQKLGNNLEIDTRSLNAKLDSFGGSGCPQDSNPPVLNFPDPETLGISYTNLATVRAGEKTKITDSRKFCQVTIRLNVPSPYQFRVKSYSYDGRIRLASASDKFTRKITAYFAGESEQSTGQEEISEEINDDIDGQVELQGDNWSKCSNDATTEVLLNLKVDRRITGSGSINNFYGSGRRFQYFELEWRRCGE